ncbi:uncharacterized protein LOC113497042 [Trichoplusia ni]|uniref:Uncharacterized protein LOC113497042 n=1 Tax=Trichoplusia ni TaxID=7111 RepID=A0A7E5VVC5_TRINI|nr:uncharacterized protein LOC113497042 [Trichoplusia ni]
MKLFVVILAAVAFVSAEESDNSLATALNFIKDCHGDYIMCVKEKMLTIVDNLRASRSIPIVDGVVFKGEPDLKARKLDALPVDPTARDAEVNYRLVDGVVSLFETHAVEVKMNQADKETLQRSLEEGRGKKKGSGALGGIIGLLGAKLLLGKLFIVKLIALKALATAKIALILAAVLFVAYCLKQEHTKTTYEVIPHAHHHESHHPVHVEHVSHDSGHGHGGGYSSYGSDWNKNLDEAQNLAYSGYSHSS